MSEKSKDFLLQLLMRDPGSEFIKLMLKRFRKIDRMLLILGKRSSAELDESFNRLSNDRVRASETLNISRRLEKNLSLLEYWRQANQRIDSFIQEGINPNISHIALLNSILLGQQQGSVYREIPIYVDQVPCSHPADIIPLMNIFEIELSRSLSNEHPIFSAALAYQWCISIHPFEDANGRTSRLLADWILGMNGYPPLSFPYLHEARLILQVNQTHPHSPQRRVEVTYNGVLRSCQILLGQNS